MIRPVRVRSTEYVLVRGVEFDRIELSHTPTPGSVMAMPAEEQAGPFLGPASQEVPEQVRAAVAGILGVIGTRVLLIAHHQAAIQAAKEMLCPHCTVLAVHSAADRGYRVVHSTEKAWPVESIIPPDHVRSPE